MVAIIIVCVFTYNLFFLFFITYDITMSTVTVIVTKQPIHTNTVISTTLLLSSLPSLLPSSGWSFTIGIFTEKHE